VAPQPQLDLIALALNGKCQGFEKVVRMINEMAENLGKKKQVDDDDKNKSCDKEFDMSKELDLKF